MDSNEEMNSNSQLKRKNPSVIDSDEDGVENNNVQTVSADSNMNIPQRETQEQRSQSVASNTVEQQQQHVEQQHTLRKRKKRLSADLVEYGKMKIHINFYQHFRSPELISCSTKRYFGFFFFK